MKKAFLSGLAIVSLTTLTTAVAFHQRSYAQSYDSTTFYCGTNNGHKATIVSNPEIGKDVPIIEWTSHWAGSEWPAERRCQEVSSRFQTYFNDGRLNFIKGGWWDNGDPVVCVADRAGGSCTGLLFTLKEGSDPNQAVKDLMDIREIITTSPMYQSSVPVSSSDKSGTYINWKEFIAAKRSAMATNSLFK